MKVFISWSGQRSSAAAQALDEWIPDVLQEVDTWMSRNIEAGQRWSRGVDAELSDTDFGILCLTRENLQRPWILFEAGALAKRVTEDARVVPYLIDDMEPSDLELPLGMFQAQKAEKEGTRLLVRSINNILENPLPQARLERIFETSWPRLDGELQKIPASETEPVQRTTEDMLTEIVDTMRGMAQAFDTIRSMAPSESAGRADTTWLKEWEAELIERLRKTSSHEQQTQEQREE